MGWLIALAILVYLGYSVYKDVRDAESDQVRQRKKKEYLWIGVGGLVVLVLLKTVFSGPVGALAQNISNYEQQVIYGNPVIITANLTDTSPIQDSEIFKGIK